MTRFKNEADVIFPTLTIKEVDITKKSHFLVNVEHE